ncbi:hypothetical protein PENSUB_8743 [Penicillium subrubescens]|uniref:Uncharacterized protein n=1 Tax=Penicillium subrubescens TaxID=1316194 RepID=A0A1Q5TF05_9EURO|nr:hypothetical protein PENSUB_8743 [Penicillium subrubescens]
MNQLVKALENVSFGAKKTQRMAWAIRDVLQALMERAHSAGTGLPWQRIAVAFTVHSSRPTFFDGEFSEF